MFCDTSSWSLDNPARGQCVSSSLVVQDYFGGDLLRHKVTGDQIVEMHYCNALPDGTILDTTGAQYREPVSLEVLPVGLKGMGVSGKKRLANAETRERCESLKARVAAYLTSIAIRD